MAIFGVALLPILAVTTLTVAHADSLPDFRSLVENEGDAVVKISVRTEQQVPVSGAPGFDLEQVPEQFRRFFEGVPNPGQPGQPRRGAGFGSGFIISEDGYIITNAHVVADATDIRVGLQDRHEYEAELVGMDPASDIALLKLDAKGLPTVTVGDSDDLAVGEWVLAIGSPFGFEHTATQGIVSALARSLPDDTYVPFIQTDVAVNPGNSGGPLFDTEGRVVGVNSQIYSRSGGYQGLSFAIPINVAMSIADQLKTKGFATRGWLGVTIQNVSQALAESFGLDRPEGALVAQVSKDSPAAKGGIESGDIILAFGGKDVPFSNALPPLVGAVLPGESVGIELLRDGKRMTLDITIEPLEGDERVANAAGAPGAEDESSPLGVVVAEVPEEARESLGIDHGVLVSDVDPDGPAAEAGIVPGDVIVSFNRREVESVESLGKLLGDAPRDEAVPVLVQRDAVPMFLALTLSADAG